MEELFRLAKSTLKEDKEIKKIKSIQRDNFHLYKNSICNLDGKIT